MISTTGQQLSNDFEHGSAASNCDNFGYTKLMLWIDKQRDRQYMIHNDIGIACNFQKHLKPTYHSWILKEANYKIIDLDYVVTAATNAVQVPRFKWLLEVCKPEFNQSTLWQPGNAQGKVLLQKPGCVSNKKGLLRHEECNEWSLPKFTQV